MNGSDFRTTSGGDAVLQMVTRHNPGKEGNMHDRDLRARGIVNFDAMASFLAGWESGCG